MNLLHEWIDGAVTAAEQRMPRISTWADDFASVITGESVAFWDLAAPYPERYDCEQDLPIYAAVRRACQLVGATPAERWALVERAIREGAARFADAMADERGDDPADTAAAREFEVDE